MLSGWGKTAAQDMARWRVDGWSGVQKRRLMIAINPVTDRHSQRAKDALIVLTSKDTKDTPLAANNAQVEPKLKASWPAYGDHQQLAPHVSILIGIGIGTAMRCGLEMVRGMAPLR